MRTPANGSQHKDLGQPTTGAVPSWAGRLRDERVRRLWSQKVMAARLRDAADQRTRAQLPAVENIARRVRSYEAGEHFPSELYVELYCRAMGLTRDALFGPSAAGRGAGVAVPTAEHDAAGLAAWITASNTTDDAIRHIDQRRAELAEAHTSLPPGLVLADVLDLHRQVQALLQSGRQRCSQTRELFRVETGLLAHASLLLDDIDHAMTARAHGKAAVLCAEEAGCSPALALSAQAKTARWQGVHLGGHIGARFFTLSADLARQGFECSPHAPVRVLLASQEASAAALLGDAARARRALRDAEDSASRTEAGPAASTWTSPSPRRAVRDVGGNPAR